MCYIHVMHSKPLYVLYIKTIFDIIRTEQSCYKVAASRI